MERVLITGANGFIGSNLCRYFLERSYEVYGLVRESSNLHFLENLPVKLVRGDLGAPGSIQLPDRIDYVIHAASVASEQTRREQALRNIYQITVNLVRLLADRRIAPRRFIYLSSTLVLGYKGRNISEANPGSAKPVVLVYAGQGDGRGVPARALPGKTDFPSSSCGHRTCTDRTTGPCPCSSWTGSRRECRPSWGMATVSSASAMSTISARPAFSPAG